MSKKIFIIDDDYGILEMFRDNLEKEGFKVYTSSESKNIMKKVTQNIPGLIILDLVMPDVDGFSVLKLLKSDKRTNGIPVIILTTYDTQEYRSKCAVLGAAKYLVKPVPIKTLVEEISRQLNEI